MVSAADLICIFTQHKPVAVLCPYILEPLVLLLFIFLTYLNHRRTRSSSTILLIFWPCYALAVTIWTRSYLWDGPAVDSLVLGLKWTVVGIGLLSCVLECISPDDSPVDSLEHPIIRANVYSIWSFSWLTPLLSKGARVTITQEDLPALVPREESERLGDDLERALKKQ